jgi:hypothetical protein
MKMKCRTGERVGWIGRVERNLEGVGQREGGLPLALARQGDRREEALQRVTLRRTSKPAPPGVTLGGIASGVGGESQRPGRSGTQRRIACKDG